MRKSIRIDRSIQFALSYIIDAIAVALALNHRIIIVYEEVLRCELSFHMNAQRKQQ